MVQSKHIIYADESGSPVLTADQKDFPIFVLVFLIIEKSQYCDKLVPAIQRLKFDFVGHDQLILHERDIRRQSGAFSFLQVSQEVRENFMDRISEIVEQSQFTLTCAIIDKAKLAQRYSRPWSPYDLALTFCMERAAKFLRSNGEASNEVNVVFEARGSNEDRHLELEFRRIASGSPRIGNPSSSVTDLTWNPIFADKKSNSTGLQVADLAARPLGLSFLKPNQTNRSARVLEKKCAYPHPKVFP